MINIIFNILQRKIFAKKQAVTSLNICLVFVFTLKIFSLQAQRPMEYLDRGLVALETQTGVFVSWRMVGTDDSNVAFNLYRNNEQVNVSPITNKTNFVDFKGDAQDEYKVETIVNGGENEMTKKIKPWPYAPSIDAGRDNLARLEIPIPTAPASNLTAGDMSVGDLDGDGDYELVFQWEGGREDNPYLDAIDLQGNHLWRISLGSNVIYNGLAILVYDFDGDGKAEVACQTGPGTIDGSGSYLSKGPAATDDDSKIYERSAGRIVEDHAYFTVFNGQTGVELATAEWPVPIGPREDMEETWEDNYGHRANSTKGAVLYDAVKGPLMVFTRGIYSKIGMGAYTWDGTTLKQEWLFDSDDYPDGMYRGEGNHGVTVADVDGDGSDELMYGACAIDNNGLGLYATGRGHGDAHALGDLDPDRPGMEYYQPHENATYGLSLRDAATGEILWEYLSPSDVGRAYAGDFTDANRGFEIVAVGDFVDDGRDDHSSVFDVKGNLLNPDIYYNAFFQPVYFDGDIQRELRNSTGVDDVNNGGRILTGWYYGANTIHSTKEDANLVADILGDWREELIFVKADNSAFVLFSSWIPTQHKVYTLMHDPAYRMQVASQNIGYNQVPNVSYYLPDYASYQPNITTIKADRSNDDDDKDGVVNIEDQCPETPEGDIVDEKGCTVLDIPNNNFTIETVSETCLGSNNGKIVVTATDEYNYVLEMKDNTYEFTETFTLEDLTPDDYEFCIYILNTSFKQCYSVTIEAGGTIEVTSKVQENVLTMEVEQGTAPYKVFVNGQKTLETSESSFTVAVNQGDSVEVITDKNCEGTITKTIDFYELMIPTPNPTHGVFDILVPSTKDVVVIEVYNAVSRISSNSYPIVNGKATLDLAGNANGVYFVKVLLQKPVVLKIIKQ
ncbi:rhamnogalacturonan lyase family protein [Wenyingzhuangia sp. IMCC45467]